MENCKAIDAYACARQSSASRLLQVLVLGAGACMAGAEDEEWAVGMAWR